MRSHHLTLGRSFGVTFDHGEDFFTALASFCRANDVRHGFVPGFIAGFAEVEIVGTYGKLDDPRAPVWSSVHLTNVEALGGGTIAYDAAAGTIAPHIHVSVGLKERSAVGHTSHLLAAKVQFLTEMLVMEVMKPSMHRERAADLYDVPLLRFDTAPPGEELGMYTYSVMLDPDLDEGGYTVTVPALPGVVTQGGTVEECLARAREAIGLHLAVLRADGEPVPEEHERPRVLTVSVPAA